VKDAAAGGMGCPRKTSAGEAHIDAFSQGPEFLGGGFGCLLDERFGFTADEANRGF
jgi:hypothetical protein